MGNQNSSASADKGQPTVPTSNPSWTSSSDTDSSSDNFQELQLERGNLLDDEDDFKDSDTTSTYSEVSAASSFAFAPSRARTLKVFNSTDFRNQLYVGEGGFGKVLEGCLQGTRVAVKIFHAPLVMEEARGEISPLMGLKHRNLVKIKGILTNTNFLDADVVSMECPQVLLDFYPEGNLLQYLSKVDNPQDYAMLGKLALDIVHGCEYLHSKGVIHGNLAARNVMVEKAMSKQKTHFNAKVGDYGISRLAKGSGGNYVTLTSGKVVPIRWVPKELVLENASGTDFTFASDVWSFGVVLWEMWTKGATPYGVSYTNMEVLEFLKAGKSPLSIHHPKGCPGHITAVMESIFKVNPYERPRFSMLKDAFEAFKQKSKTKNAREHGAEKESTQVKKQQTETEQTQCKKDDRSTSPVQRKVSKGEDATGDNGETNASQGKPKNSGNAYDQQYRKSDKGELKSSKSPSEQRQDGRQSQPQKHFSGSKGRGGKPKHLARGPFPSGPPHHGHGKNSGRTATAPPPYTPSPLPNHSAYFGPGQTSLTHMGYQPSQTNFEDEIKRREEEIKMLQTQRVTEEIRRKTAELADALQRAATIGINSVAGQNQNTGSNPGGGYAPRNSMHPSPSHHSQQINKNSRGGGGRGGGGRGGRGGKAKNEQIAS